MEGGRDGWTPRGEEVFLQLGNENFARFADLEKKMSCVELSKPCCVIPCRRSLEYQRSELAQGHKGRQL